MPYNGLRSKILSTSMLVAPVALVLVSSIGVSPAFADCTVTSGGGTVASPTNGSVLTCSTSGGAQTSTIGAGIDTVGASVNLEDNAAIFVTGDAIQLDSITLTLGTNATIATTGNNNEAIIANTNTENIDAIITLGDNASISTTGTNAKAIELRSLSGNINLDLTLDGDNSSISTITSTGIALRTLTGNITQNITLSGDDSMLDVYVFTETLGSNTQYVTLSGARAQVNGSFITWAGGYNNVTQIIVLSGNSTNITDSYSPINGFVEDGLLNQTVTLSGNNASIESNGNGYGSIFGYTFSNGQINQTVTLSGQNTRIYASGDSLAAIKGSSYAPGIGSISQIITLSGSGAEVSSTGSGSQAISAYSASGTAQTHITLGQDTSVISQQDAAISVYGGGGGNSASTIDSAGLIQGATYSIILDDGNDFLTLRTGSNLSSLNGADLGAGHDTLTLIGHGSEDETFLNIETLNILADAQGWNFTTTSTFDDIHLNSGLFRNNGDLTATSLTVHSGSTLGGSGIFTGDIFNSGTVAPGNSIGTQTIIGNFSQGPGGILSIEVDKLGNSDLLDITGTATLDGTVRFSGSNMIGVPVGQTYTFLRTTGGVFGSFNKVEDNFLFLDIGNVQTVGNEVQASVISRASFGNAAQNKNQMSVSKTLDKLVAAGEAADIDLLINSLSSTEAASDFLETQSGTITLNSVSSATKSVGDVLNVVQKRMSTLISGNNNTSYSKDTSPGAMSNLTPASGMEYGSTGYIWGQAVAGFGDVNSDTNAKGSDYNSRGFAFGIDRELNEGGIYLGLFGAFSKTNTEMNGLGDTSNVDNYQFGLYGLHQLSDNLYINGTLSASWLDFQTSRPTVLGKAKGDFNGYGVFGHLEAMYDIEREDYVFSPYIGMETSHIYQDGYKESGADTLNIEVSDSSTHKIASEIGVQVKTETYVQDVVVIPTFKIGWQHEFGDTHSQISSNFASAPSAVFTSQGPEEARDSARLMLDMNLAKADDTDKNLYVRYDGDLSRTSQNHAITAGFKLRW